MANVLTRCFKSLINELKGFNDLVDRIVELESNKAVIDSVNESLVAENKRLCLCTAQVSRFSRISRMRTSYS